MGRDYFLAFATSGLVGVAARKLLQPDEETPIKDESPPTLSTRGSYIPVLIGERRISPFIAWTGNRTKEEEKAAGGKGVNAPGNDAQIVYYEDGVHVLAVGPAYQLTDIKINGKNAKFNDGVPITFDGSFSGASYTTKDGDTFQIFWGDDLGGVIQDPEDLANSLGVNTKWYRLVIVFWKHKRLGGFPTWPSVQYTLQIRPHVTAVDTSSWRAESWMQNGPGPNGTPHQILGVNNSSKVGDATDFPYVKVWNEGADARTFYKPGGFCEISEQPFLLANRIYSIAASTYDAGEVYARILDQDWSKVSSSSVEEEIDSWAVDTNVTLNKNTGSGLTWPTGYTSADGDLVTIINDAPLVLGGAYTNSTVNVPYGALQFRFWIYGIDDIVNTCTWVKFGLAKLGTSHVEGPFVSITRDPVDNTYNILTSGDDDYPGDKYTVRDVKFNDAGNGWFFVNMVHRIAEADVPFIPTIDKYQPYISCYNGQAGATQAKIRIFNYEHEDTDVWMIRKNEGNYLQGITTVEFAEPLLDIESDVGLIEGYSENSPKGAGGPNPAYSLAQLLFEPFPYGRGLSQDLWDIDSLGIFADIAKEDGLRLHILASEGKSVQKAVEAILVDSYAYIAWDPEKGKYVFGTLRDPEIVRTLPKEALARNYAEQETFLDPDIPSIVTYSFTDRNLGYRKNTQPVYDDANSYLRGRKTETANLETPTDVFTARFIAARRRDEITIPTTTYKILGKGESRTLIPGDYIKVDGFPSEDAEEVLTVLGVTIPTDSPEVEIEAVTNVVSLAGEEDLGPLNSPDDGFNNSIPEPAPDLYTTLWELPPFLTDDEISVASLRIAANQYSITADILASNDNNEYSHVGSNKAAIGGILVEDIPTTTQFVMSERPIITPVGARAITEVPSLTDLQWQRGRTLVYINGEVFYLKKVTPTGAGGYFLDGLIRARLGTRKVSHIQGDVVYIFKESEVKAFSDMGFSVGNEIYLKAQPAGLSPTYAQSYDKRLSGFGIRPLPVHGVRTGNLSNHYRPREDIDLSWVFYDPPAFRGRYGSGFQRAGEKKEETTEPLGYFRVTFRSLTTVLREVETRKNTVTYSNADLVADTGGPEPDTVSVDIEMIQNGYRSATTTLEVVKL